MYLKCHLLLSLPLVGFLWAALDLLLYLPDSHILLPLPVWTGIGIWTSAQCRPCIAVGTESGTQKNQIEKILGNFSSILKGIRFQKSQGSCKELRIALSKMHNANLITWKGQGQGTLWPVHTQLQNSRMRSPTYSQQLLLTGSGVQETSPWDPVSWKAILISGSCIIFKSWPEVLPRSPTCISLGRYVRCWGVSRVKFGVSEQGCSQDSTIKEWNLKVWLYKEEEEELRPFMHHKGKVGWDKHWGKRFPISLTR